MNLTYVGSNPWRQNGSLPRVFLNQLRGSNFEVESFYATRTPPAYAAARGALPGVKRYLVLLLLSAKESISPFCMPNMCRGRNCQTPTELSNIIQIFVMPIDHAGHLAFQGGSRFAMGLWMEQERHR
ncbi:hypothetical protein SDC9_12502 [bioreactor metagenome]|uniref:Uncharacterized protein n=1 Tax=bioreactor metagenome TaxID=1076179 RepID=A0A644TIV3_9ZZZZ